MTTYRFIFRVNIWQIIEISSTKDLGIWIFVRYGSDMCNYTNSIDRIRRVCMHKLTRRYSSLNDVVIQYKPQDGVECQPTRM